MLLSYSVLGIVAGGYVLGWEDALLTEIGRATIGFTSRRTARGIDRLKGTRLLDPNLHCVHLLRVPRQGDAHGRIVLTLRMESLIALLILQ
jgi:hypothetical protein